MLIVFEILAVAAASSIFILIARNAAENDIANRMIIAEQITMSANALLAVPGNAWLEFPANLSRYTEKFERNEVGVYRDEASLPVKSFFVTFDDIWLEGIFRNKPNVYMIKEGGVLRVSSEKPRLRQMEQVPDAESRNAEWKSELIMLSPKVAEGRIDLFVQAMADYMKVRNANAVQADYIEEGKKPIARIMVREVNEQGVIRIHYSQIMEEMKNRKLAVILGNNLGLLEDTQIFVASGTGREFEYANVSIIIDIDANTKKRSDEVFNAVYSALEEYYEK